MITAAIKGSIICTMRNLGTFKLYFHCADALSPTVATPLWSLSHFWLSTPLCVWRAAAYTLRALVQSCSTDADLLIPESRRCAPRKGSFESEQAAKTPEDLGLDRCFFFSPLAFPASMWRVTWGTRTRRIPFGIQLDYRLFLWFILVWSLGILAL